MTQSLNNSPRIAIPMPHSEDRAYAERAVSQYEDAVRGAGGEPVRIDFDQSAEEIKKTLATCNAVLLPGSRADVDPAKYQATRHPKTVELDAKRDSLDHLLLDDAYRARKPVLGICYGLQSLNVYRAGSLVQHIESAINHSAGRAVPKAHEVTVDPKSRLAKIVGVGDSEPIAVNSSHHQSADLPGKDLRVVARSPEDGVIEALEGTEPDHFVLAVQWHPERSVNDVPELAESAHAIFKAFVESARANREQSVEDLAAKKSEATRVRGDFNGLFGDVLCLSHEDTCVAGNGEIVKLHEGMKLTAFDEDGIQPGKPEYILASGTVEPSPEWLSCRGSRWILRIDERGVRRQSDLSD
ncbi:MAG: gamma-glutamyl-gamma-aminobutyrate hydrolase family protein [Terriglobales bacterium]